MKNQWIKVPLGYAVYSAIYFPVAFFLDAAGQRKGSSGWVRFFNELDSIVFWGNAIMIYIFSLMGTSLIASLWFYKRYNKALFKGFGIMFILSVVSFLLLIIFACMQ